MVGRKKTPANKAPQLNSLNPGEADLNEVVAYNFRLARELRGWTQEEAAQALEPLLGQRLPQASISAIERAYDGERRREFDAQEVLAFALAFDLPLLWFFLPPPANHRAINRPAISSASCTGSSSGEKTSSDRSTTGSASSASTNRARPTGLREPDRKTQPSSSGSATSNGAKRCSSPPRPVH